MGLAPNNPPKKKKCQCVVRPYYSVSWAPQALSRMITKVWPVSQKLPVFLAEMGHWHRWSFSESWCLHPEVQHKISEQYYACKVLHKAWVPVGPGVGNGTLWISQQSQLSILSIIGANVQKPSLVPSLNNLFVTLGHVHQHILQAVPVPNVRRMLGRRNRTPARYERRSRTGSATVWKWRTERSKGDTTGIPSGKLT